MKEKQAVRRTKGLPVSLFKETNSLFKYKNINTGTSAFFALPENSTENDRFFFPKWKIAMQNTAFHGF